MTDPTPSPSNQGYVGAQDETSGSGLFNSVAFMIRQQLAQIWTTAVVKVKAVTNSGDVSPVGSVDVQPMVSQIDGQGNVTEHGTIFGVPYLRLQGGANAVIIDPQVDDIGIMVCAMRDISAVKSTKAIATPGSRRILDPADGLYLGGVLNGSPTQYLRFSSDGVEIVSGTKVTLKVGGVTVVLQSDGIHLTGPVIINGVTFNTHVHGGVTTGGGSTTGPV